MSGAADFAASVTPSSGSPVRATSVRLVTQWKGVWFADVDLDPDSAPVALADVPTGKVTVTIQPAGLAAIVLVGTVDPSASGRFVSTVRVRVLGGGGGWGKTLPAQAWNNSSGGISALTVEQACAGQVGETVNDQAPLSLGTDWVQPTGRASKCFGDRDWYVDPAGITQVGSRPAATPDASLELLMWDPLQQRGQVSADALVLPGTVLTDARFDGPITVRDVEQVFDAKGSRAIVWCSEAVVARLASALTNMVRELGKLDQLKVYRYRIVSQSTGGLELQAVPNPDGTASSAPESLQDVVIWPGMGGLSGKFAPSSQVLVTFIAQPDGSFAPFVFSFDPAVLPVEVTIDATGITHVGPSGDVELAGGGPGIAGLGDTILAYLPPLCPVSGTLSGLPFVGVMQVPGPLIGSIQTASNKARRG